MNLADGRIHSATGGDRRTQMRLAAKRRIRADELPPDKATCFNVGTVRCCNCGETYPAGTIRLSRAAIDLVRARRWMCGPCWRADNMCATCHRLIRIGQRSINNGGSPVHKNGCPAK